MRDKIIEQTFKLLLCKGYDGVSVSDIQHAVGISRGLLYHYFGNKEALFLEAAKHHLLLLFQIEKEKTASFNLEQMCTYILAKYRRLLDETLEGISIINYDFLLYRAMQESSELTAVYQRIRSDELDAWLIALRNAQQRGELRPELDLQKLSRQFIYVTDGVWLSAVTPSVEINLITSLNEAFETLCSLIKK